MRILVSLLIFLYSFDAFCNESTQKVDTNKIVEIFVAAHAMQDRNIDSAYLLAQEGYKQSEKANYIRGLGMAFMRMGSILSEKGVNDTALIYMRLALQIRIQIRDLNAAASTSSELSYIHQSLGSKDSAFHYLYQTIRLYEQTKNEVGLANTYTELGKMYLDYGDRVKALKYLHQSVDAFLKMNPEDSQEGLIAAYSNLGDYEFKGNHFKEALKHYINANTKALTTGHIYHIANSNNNIGLCYANLKEYNKAISHYQMALNYYIQSNYMNDVALVYNNLGILYDNKNKLDSAFLYMNKSLTLSRSLQNTAYIISALKYLSYLYAKKGNYLAAYNHHLEYAQLSDSLLNHDKVKQIAEMQTKYETEKKEDEIILLNQENKTKVAQRNFFIAGSIILVLGIFILGFYYIQRNRLAKKNEQIAQQKVDTLMKEQEIKSYNAMIEGQEEERKRIASDLHDRLGSMLSTVKLLFGALDTKIDKAQEENKNQYIKANALLDEACIEVRRISHNLSTGMVVSFGLVAALEELAESINHSQIVKCKLMTYGMNERLDQKTEIGLYRMIQELINNILKHAQAKQITIQINRTEESINVTLEDDGIGFNVAEKRKSGGMGLSNLETRAANLNGVYHVDSSPGKGTISIIEIPLTQNTI